VTSRGRCLAHRDIWLQRETQLLSRYHGHGRIYCRLDAVASLGRPSMTSRQHVTSLARRRIGADLSAVARRAQAEGRNPLTTAKAAGYGFASNPPYGLMSSLGMLT
jgi:hypothetical protein